MKQPWKIVGMWGAPALMAGVVLYALLWGRAAEAPNASLSPGAAGPPRLVENGPYVRDLVMSWSEGGVDVTLSASRLCFVKSRFLGMDNALMKKMRLDDVLVTVRRGHHTLLRLAKGRVEGAPSGKRFALEAPRVLYPQGARQPDRAVVDKEHRKIIFWYGKEGQTLDFLGPHAVDLGDQNRNG